MKDKRKIVRTISLILLIGGLVVDLYGCYSSQPESVEVDLEFQTQLASSPSPFESISEHNEADSDSEESLKDRYDFIQAELIVKLHTLLDEDLFEDLCKILFQLQPLTRFIKYHQIII